MVQQRERRFACLASLPSDRSSEASFVRTFQKPTTRKPVRFTSYAATTRIRRSRSNVLHSAHGIAYAAGQQHSLPPHTRKVTGSIPAGTITSSCRQSGWASVFCDSRSRSGGTISGHLSTSQKRNLVRIGVGACDSVGFGTTRMGFEAGCEAQGSLARGAGGGRPATVSFKRLLRRPRS